MFGKVRPALRPLWGLTLEAEREETWWWCGRGLLYRITDRSGFARRKGQVRSLSDGVLVLRSQHLLLAPLFQHRDRACADDGTWGWPCGAADAVAVGVFATVNCRDWRVAPRIAQQRCVGTCRERQYDE